MICISCKHYDAEHTTCQNIKARYVGCDECFKWEKKKSTNADRIRQMTDEELAEFITARQGVKYHNEHYEGTKLHWLDWLKEEVDDG